MTEIHDVFRALADPVRLAMVERLSVGPAPVGTLGDGLGISKPAVTRHLRVLVDAGLVTRTRHGRVISCALQPEPLGELADWLTDRWAYWAGSQDRAEMF